MCASVCAVRVCATDQLSVDVQNGVCAHAAILIAVVRPGDCEVGPFPNVGVDVALRYIDSLAVEAGGAAHQTQVLVVTEEPELVRE